MIHYLPLGKHNMLFFASMPLVYNGYIYFALGMNNLKRDLMTSI